MFGTQGGRRDGLPPKPTTATALRLDVRALVAQLAGPKPTCPADGGLHGWGTLSALLGYELVVIHDGGALAVTHGLRAHVDRIALVTLSPRRGRRQQWLACCPGCSRRVACLYGFVGVPFRCVACGGLTHASSALSKFDRFGRKAADLMNRLCIDTFDEGHPNRRPHGMRRRTFDRLRAELQAARAREVDHARKDLGGFLAGFYKLPGGGK